MARTERESDNRRREMADLLVLPRPAKSVQNGADFSGKTRAYWACRKGKSGLSATERTVGKNAGAFFTKMEHSRLSKAPDDEGRQTQGGREGGSEREHGVERGDSTVKEGRFQGGQGGQARRASLEEVEGSTSG